jgi:hypothetical protein
MKTSENLTRQLTLEELISLVEASHVNPTPLQDSEKESKTNATCGQRCLELFESVNPVGSWARTFAGYVLGITGWCSKRCALTWKLVGTPYNRLYFQLVPSTPPTEETEFGLLLTPTTSERSEHPDEMRARAETKGYRNGTKYNSLMSQILYGNMLPTPRTADVEGAAVKNVKTDGKGYYRENAKGERWGVKLRDVVESGMFPTPTAQAERANASVDRGKGNLSDEVATRFQIGGKSSQLSPLFVEEMMGFPKNWTVSPFQSGEENPSKPTETP